MRIKVTSRRSQLHTHTHTHTHDNGKILEDIRNNFGGLLSEINRVNSGSLKLSLAFLPNESSLKI